MRFLKGFQQFINESSDNYSEAEYMKIPVLGEPIKKLLEACDAQANHMMDRSSYWYNRESREQRSSHYAINVKTYEWPDVDDWREAIGEPDEYEETMMDHWFRFLNDEIEDFEQNVFLEKFGADFDKISMGGRSGGWMLLVPDKDPEDIISDLNTYLDSYMEAVNELSDAEIQEINSILNLTPEERENLAEVGLIGDTANYDHIMNEYNDLKREAEDALKTLKTHEEACQFVIKAHEEFEQTAKETFLENERENYHESY